MLDYDELIVATGATAGFFGITGAAEHAHPLYTLADARRLRNLILAVPRGCGGPPEAPRRWSALHRRRRWRRYRRRDSWCCGRASGCIASDGLAQARLESDEGRPSRLQRQAADRLPRAGRSTRSTPCAAAEWTSASAHRLSRWQTACSVSAATTTATRLEPISSSGRAASPSTGRWLRSLPVAKTKGGRIESVTILPLTATRKSASSGTRRPFRSVAKSRGRSRREHVPSTGPGRDPVRPARGRADPAQARRARDQAVPLSGQGSDGHDRPKGGRRPADPRAGHPRSARMARLARAPPRLPDRIPNRLVVLVNWTWRYFDWPSGPRLIIEEP